MKKEKHNIVIKNRKASFNYEFLEKEIAGISLVGSEVKSIKYGNASIGEAHCYIQEEECFIIGMYVSEHKEAGRGGHKEPYRTRKLLLTKKQIRKWDKELKTKGNTIVPVKLFVSKGKIKIEIAICRGKKLYDKRNSLKEKQITKDINRAINN